MPGPGRQHPHEARDHRMTAKTTATMSSGMPVEQAAEMLSGRAMRGPESQRGAVMLRHRICSRQAQSGNETVFTGMGPVMKLPGKRFGQVK